MTSSGAFGLALAWPLGEGARHFDLGHLINCAVTDALPPQATGTLAHHHAGLWECDLSDDSLIWSGGVYDLFGLQRSSSVTREQAVAHYSEDSRAKLERLRSAAIRRQEGFTLDVEIRAAAVGQVRRMRLIGAPFCEDGLATRLRGLKIAI